MSARTIATVFLSFALILSVAPDASAQKTARAKTSKVSAAKRLKTKSRRAGVKTTRFVKARLNRASEVGSKLRQKLFKKKSDATPLNKAAKTRILSKRKVVKERVKSAKVNRKAGLLETAAEDVTSPIREKVQIGGMEDSPVRERTITKLTIRERFALFLAARSLRKVSMKQAKKRSKKGDLEGTKDALEALSKLQSAGRLGPIARWRKKGTEKKVYKNSVKAANKALEEGEIETARALHDYADSLPGNRSLPPAKLAERRSKAGDIQGTKDALEALKNSKVGRLGALSRYAKKRKQTKTKNKVYKNAVKAASSAIKGGDTDAAKALQEFAVGLKGDTKATRKAYRELAQESFDLARSYAKAGNPSAASKALMMASQFQVKGSKKFNQKKADRIMVTAYSRAVKTLVKAAKADAKAGDLADAATKLAEVQQMMRSVEVKTSWLTRRSLRRLTRDLGPHIEKAKKAMNPFKPLKNSEELAELAESASEAVAESKKKSRNKPAVGADQVVMVNGGAK